MSKYTNISRYLYAVLSALPIGLILLWFGFKEITLTENKLDKKTGRINELIIKPDQVVIKIKKSNIYYHTAIPKRVKILSKELKKGDKIAIYRIKGQNELNYIEKLEKNGEVLVEFEKALLVPIIAFILGLVISIFVCIYLVKNFSDLFGGDKEKMEDFLDPWRKDKK